MYDNLWPIPSWQLRYYMYYTQYILFKFCKMTKWLKLTQTTADHLIQSPAYSNTRLPRTMTKKVFNIFKDRKYTGSLGLSTVKTSAFLCSEGI